MKLTNIGILGAGSIGCYLGAHFISAGIDTILVGREKLAQEIHDNGLLITDFRGKRTYLSPEQVKCTTDINALADRDLILVTLKSMVTEETAHQLKSVVGDRTIVVSFQNGVRNATTLRSILTQTEVLAGMVPFNVVWNPGAHFHCGTSGMLIVEEHINSTEKVLSALHNAGLEAKGSTNVQGILWGKLIFNLNNAINALAGVTLREELSQVGYRKIIAAAMREALSILKQSGIRPQSSGSLIPTIAPFILSLPDFLFFRIASGMIKIDPQARSSMWQDLQRARKTEIDYINGEILNLAGQHKLAAPVNKAIVAMIKEAEQTGQVPCLSASELAKRLSVSISEDKVMSAKHR
ncbi:MAG: 2-dehydropantoate 2-reductase [Acidobacteriota bacterium]